MDTSEQVSESWRPFADDLWINRRLKLGEVLDQVDCSSKQQKISKETAAGFRDLLAFLRFLKSECTGTDFSTDRQWSELLNIMQISRKLNHRSVRFKDIMLNKEIIEANKVAIHELNTIAKVGRAIDCSLKDLESLSQALKLNIPVRTKDESCIVDEISASTEQIQCKTHQFRLIKSEIDGEHLKKAFGLSVIETWKVKSQRLSAIFNKLDSFLRELMSLETNLMQLQPLMSIDSADNEVSSYGANQLSLLDQIRSCKRTYCSIRAFRTELLSKLAKFALSKGNKSTEFTSIQLIKLLDNQCNFVEGKFDSELNNSVERLIVCRKALDKIMQDLRLEFGRFYFVNNIELLTIIALDTNLVLQSDSVENSRLMRKLFGNSISSLLTHENRLVVGVKSALGEEISLLEEEFVPIRKKINVYSVEIVRILNELARKLRNHLKRLLLDSFNEDNDATCWTLPVQLVIVSEYIIFTRRVEQSLEGSSSLSIDDLMLQYQSKLTDPSTSKQLAKDKLGKLKRAASGSLAVKFISILLMLKSNKVSAISDWSWQKQVRYYVVANQGVEVRLAGSKFEYKFDFLHIESNNFANRDDAVIYKRLIDTRATERCMLTASYAVSNLGLGANPYGPAGSGKTETIKALGNLLGCHVVVHNCDDSNDSESLERLIWGLAHTGLWGCFDEFNRLSSSVLSSVSAVLEKVQLGLREKKPTVEWLDGEVRCIDATSAFFITFNPGDNDKYRGRRQIPANLRGLFVPVSMVQLQVGSIVSESLMNLANASSLQGISPMDATEVGGQLEDLLKKLKVWCRNSTRKIHCECDLRLVMAILSRFRLLVGHSGRASSCFRDTIARAVMVEIAPRLVEDDCDTLRQIVESCLNVRAESRAGEDDEELERQLIERVQCNDTVQSAMKLHSQLRTRGGVILLGPPKSGKSASWRALHSACSDTIKWSAINPKSVTKLELFGRFDAESGKWSDGLLTNRMREAQQILLNSNEIQQVWLVLDGPIDPDWVEQLNSALDDNRTLTLSSGERLDLCPLQNKAIKLIFETTDIQNASPATLSRLGLVLFDKSHCDVPICGRKIEASRGQLEADDCDIINDISELTILTGATQRERNLFLMKLAGRTNSVLQYTCCKLTNASHLEDLIGKHAGYQYTVLENIEVVDFDDQWSTRSLVESLRYIATYHEYPFAVDRKTSGSRFVVTVKSASKLDARLTSCATVIDIGASVEKEDDLIAIEGPGSNFNPPGMVFAISSPTLGLDCRCLLEANLKNSKLLTFQDANEIQKTMDSLEKVIASEASNEEPSLQEERHLIVLHEHEYRLIPISIQAQLLHSLNLLKLSGRNDIKFAYICHRIQANPGEHLFWSSIGRVYEYRDETAAGKLISECLTMISITLSESNRDWIRLKVESLVERKRSEDKFNLIELKSFLNVLQSSLQFISQTVQTQKSTLENGLDRLAQFEQGIERTKTKLKHENEDILSKKDHIEHLMAGIDKTLSESTGRKKQLEELRNQQVSKNEEMELRGSRLRAEMASVEKLVDESKREISQHLRPEALNEIKTLRSPPKTIKDILDVLFVLLEVKDTSWSSIKSTLAKRSLVDELSKYDFQKRLNETLIMRVEEEIKLKGASFNLQQAARASNAVTPIVMWIEAAVSYGKVLIKLRPLTDEMDKLRVESRQLDESKSKLEAEQAQVDEHIRRESSRLEKFRSELRSAERTAASIKDQLESAQEVRAQLDNQVQRWRQKLLSFAELHDQNRQVKLALFSAYIAIYHNGTEEHLGLLGNEAELENWNELIVALLSFHEDACLNDVAIETLNLTKVASLLATELLLESCNLIPFYHADCSPGNQVGPSELASFLGRPGSCCIVKCSEQNADWQLEVDVGVELNKLIILHLDDGSRDLEVAKLIMTRRPRQRIVLLGQMDKHQHLRHLFRLFHISRELDKVESLELKIVSSLIQIRDPGLDAMVNELGIDLRAKQAECKSLEAKLLANLAHVSSGDGNPRDELLNGNLVGALSNLNRVNDKLTSDIARLNANMHELQEQQSKYAMVAREAAGFYRSHLLNLADRNAFHHVPLARYIDLLVKGNGAGEKGSLNYANVINYVLLSMQPSDREEFTKGLPESIRASDLQNGRSVQLSGVIDDLLTAMLPGERKRKLMILVHDAKKSNPMIELDEIFRRYDSDSTKRKLESSGVGGTENNKDTLGGSVCHYSKVYASSDSNYRLEVAVRRILSGDHNAIPIGRGESTGSKRESYRKQTSPERTNNCKANDAVKYAPNTKATATMNTQTDPPTRCLCIANAHLSARWINRHLVGLMKFQSAAATTTNQVGGAANVLIILIVESTSVGNTSSGDDNHGFAADVIELAEVKYWHDELALPLASRFNLMRRSMEKMMIPRPPVGRGSDGGRVLDTKISERGDDCLNNQLIMLHVICQELAKLGALESLKRTIVGLRETWRGNYLFDHDQLWLAFRVLGRLQRELSDDGAAAKLRLRPTFCNYLLALVYGSRMECEEDERLLEKVLANCIGRCESAVEKANQLNRLLALQHLRQIGTDSKVRGDSVPAGGGATDAQVNEDQVRDNEKAREQQALADLISFVE